MAKRPLKVAETPDELKESTSKKKRSKRTKLEDGSSTGHEAAEQPNLFDKTLATHQDHVNGSSDTSGLSKSERKALRRLKKEQGKAAAAQEAVQNGAENGDAKAEQNGADNTTSTVNGHTAKTSVSELHRPLLGIVSTVDGGDAYYRENQIKVEDKTDRPCPPIQSFDGLPFDRETRAKYFGSFNAPTPIQAATWPYLLKGRDLIGVAETGSGKTFAFGVPCILRSEKKRKIIQTCIVSPTRELALQIHDQMNILAEPRGIRVTCVYGGVSKDDQRRLLVGTGILVATPGRLNDFIQDGTIDLSGVTYLVLDEADRMLDKGFEQDVRKIIGTCAQSNLRQTLMFTATWPPSIRELAAEYLRDPVKIKIGKEDASGEPRANSKIIQEVEVIEDHEKQPRLIQILKQYQSGKHRTDRILVFCLYKKEATRIEEFIRRRGFPVAGIHGDLNQHKRTESLESFKSGQVPLLVATDVAARGLDIPAVKLVLNVTFPLTVEDYVHRIGRYVRGVFGTYTI